MRLIIKTSQKKIAPFQNDVLVQKRKEILEQEKFFNVYSITPAETDIFGSETVTAVSSALKYWAENASFYICQQCQSVVPVKMPYNFIERPQISLRNKCRCTKARYQVPRLPDIPKQLLSLSAECIRQKTCYPFRIGYANTMCKVQGQMLEKAILWFDVDNIPTWYCLCCTF